MSDFTRNDAFEEIKIIFARNMSFAVAGLWSLLTNRYLKPTKDLGCDIVSKEQVADAIKRVYIGHGLNFHYDNRSMVLLHYKSNSDSEAENSSYYPGIVSLHNNANPEPVTCDEDIIRYYESNVNAALISDLLVVASKPILQSSPTFMRFISTSIPPLFPERSEES